MPLPTNWYQTCHNAEPGTYGHECGKPASWIADKPSTLEPGAIFTSSFCVKCRATGSERIGFTNWRPAA